MQKKQTLTIGFSLEILEQKIRTFQQKQRQWIQSVKQIGIIQLPQESNRPAKLNDENQLINYRFQLLYNRIKRLMDTESLMLQRLMINSSSKTSSFIFSNDTPRNQNYELYQVINDTNKKVSNLQIINNHFKTKISQLQSQNQQLNSKLKHQKQTSKIDKQNIFSLQLNQKAWSVQKQHLTKSIQLQQIKINQQLDKIQEQKQKLVRSCVEKQGLTKEILRLNQFILIQKQDKIKLDESIKNKIENMKIEVRQELKIHIQNLQVQQSVSYKLFKKLVNSPTVLQK